MKYFVNDNCIGCGLCAEICPEVFEITEIEPADQIAFIQPTDESIITLYTCTPIREATHRLLVRAEKIYEEECI